MSEIEQLKLESETNVQRLTSKHEQEIEMERERAHQAELTSQQRYEERKEAETRLIKELQETSYYINSWANSEIRRNYDEFAKIDDSSVNL